MNEPTIVELMSAYREIAEIERIKSDRPCRRRVDNVLSGIRSVCRLAGVPLSAPLSALTPQRMNGFFVAASQRGLRRITIRNYTDSVRSLTARWCRTYYCDRGWIVLPFNPPLIRKETIRYERPSPEMLASVRAWYTALLSNRDKMPWLAATLMLEFGMRNGDAQRLTWDCFVRRGNKIFLSYKPNKTALSSGRVVRWPVHHELWRILAAMREDGSQRVLRNGRAVYRKLNSELRKLGFTGSKATYELRKICIDHIYQRFGAEMAVSISGDDIRTVTRYYADPSAVVQDSVRVSDLLAACE